MRTTRRYVALGAALLAVASAVTVRADTVIREREEFAWKRGVQGPLVEERCYRLEATRARLDQATEAYFVDTESGDFYALDLEARHFYRYPSPLTLESTTPPELRELVRDKRRALMPRTIKVTPTDEVKHIAGFEAHRVRIDAGGPDEPVTVRLDLWLSLELGREVADTAYRALERDRLSTSALTSWLADVEEGLSGYPVRAELVMVLQDGRMRTEYVREVVSVEHSVDVPAETFRIPEGFTPFPRPASGLARPRN